VSVNESSALQFSPVFAAVRKISETIASLPLFIYREGSKGKKKDIKHPLYPILHHRPNPEQTRMQMWEALMSHLLLWGNCYCHIQQDLIGRPIALWPLDPSRMEVKRPDPSGPLVYQYRLTDSGDKVNFPPWEILHIAGLGFNGTIGYSIISLAREGIATGMAYEEYAGRFFANNATPSGFIEVPGFLSPETMKTIREDWYSNYGGVSKSQLIGVIGQGMKFNPISVNHTDAQFLESRKFSVTEVCRWFNIAPHMIFDLERCMPADTLVFTNEGPKKIAEVQSGDSVWSHTPHGLKLNRVLKNWNNGIGEILSIRTTNRHVRCTGNHRLLVRRSHERDLNPGETGGRNVNGVKKRIIWRDEYVPASELKLGDTLVTLNSLPEEGKRIAPNGRPLSVGFMEFCGLLLADGNIRYTAGKPIGIQISRALDASYMDSYREIMQREFVRYDGGNGRGNQAAVACVPVTLVEQDRQTAFSSVQVAYELKELGFAGTAFTKRVPAWIFATSEDLRLAVLRGFLDGDGTVDKKGRITYYSANKALLDDVRHLCMSCGIPVTNSRSDINKKPAPGSIVLVPTQMFRFTCSDPGANFIIGSHDTRYQSRLTGGKPFNRKNRSYPRFGGKASITKGLALSRINNIERQPAEPVFDIEVEGDHCFIADGVISHNSTNNNIEQQSLESVIYTFRPWCVRIEQAIQNKLITEGNVTVEHRLEGLLRGDTASRTAYYMAGIQNGWLCPNDIRELENMELIDDGDTYLRPLNMVPLGEDTPPPEPLKKEQNVIALTKQTQA
jgi:HK97 family phage portal protein